MAWTNRCEALLTEGHALNVHRYYKILVDLGFSREVTAWQESCQRISLQRTLESSKSRFRFHCPGQPGVEFREYNVHSYLVCCSPFSQETCSCPVSFMLALFFLLAEADNNR